MSHRGFTLVEVMIALSILAGGLVVLLRVSAANVANSRRAKMMGIAVNLARGKMYDLEEELLDKGFDQNDQTPGNTFDEEGWPKIRWDAKIEKIELPNLNALSAAEKGLAEDKDDGEKDGTSGTSNQGLGGMLGMAGLGSAGQEGATDLGAGLIGSIFPMISNVLEESIRKVTLKVSWTIAGHEQSFTSNCYFTDPSAIQRVVSGVPAQTPDSQPK